MLKTAVLFNIFIKTIKQSKEQHSFETEILNILIKKSLYFYVTLEISYCKYQNLIFD